MRAFSPIRGWPKTYYRTPDMPHTSRGARNWPSRRRVALVTGVLLFATCLFLFLETPEISVRWRPQSQSLHDPLERLNATCGPDSFQHARDKWQASKAKHEKLMDDKFTIVIPSYKRPDILNSTLQGLLAMDVPSLHEIVVVWIDIDSAAPSDFISEFGVKVRHRVPQSKSLNVRFWPDPEIQTKAVLHQDDDIWYRPEDLEFVFSTWRHFGQNKITGAAPRCVKEGFFGGLKYAWCSKRHSVEESYSIILTNLAFMHISIMDFYWSDNEQMRQIREHVDDVFNCEDIAANFAASMLTCVGPLHVTGEKPYEDYQPKNGISRNSHHWQTRSTCLDRFTDIMGYNALIESQGHLQNDGSW